MMSQCAYECHTNAVNDRLEAATGLVCFADCGMISMAAAVSIQIILI